MEKNEAHLRIAHSIGELLIVSLFSAVQRRILDLILRLSWGCGKNTAFILRQRNFEVVGVSECRIKANIDFLIQANVIVRDGRYYSFNKDFEKWQVRRAPQYRPEMFKALVSLNLRVPDPGSSIVPKEQAPSSELAKTESPNLLKEQVQTYPNRKSLTSEPASPKEILKKIKYKADIKAEDAKIAKMEKEIKGFTSDQAESLKKELESLRERNLRQATFAEKGDLIARLGIMIYPSEYLKSRRITCKMNIKMTTGKNDIVGVAKGVFGEPSGIRTQDHLLKREMLCRLS
jgi:Bacteriophage replication protein O